MEDGGAGAGVVGGGGEGMGLGAVVACFVASGLSAAAGVGGGGIYVPSLMMLKGWSVNVAIPVSHVMISTSAVAMLGANLVVPARGDRPAAAGEASSTSPSPAPAPASLTGAERQDGAVLRVPAINVDALLVFVSISLSTTVFGVLLNMTLPRWVTGSLLLAFLCHMAVKTVAKARGGDGGRTGLLACKAGRGRRGAGGGAGAGVGAGASGCSSPERPFLAGGDEEGGEKLLLLGDPSAGEPRGGTAVLVSQASSLLLAAEEGARKRPVAAGGGDGDVLVAAADPSCTVGGPADPMEHALLVAVDPGERGGSGPREAPPPCAAGGAASGMGWAAWKVVTLLTLWLFLVVCAGLRKDSIGGKMLGIERCGLIWWMLVAAPVTVGGVSGYLLLQRFTGDYNALVQQGARFPEGEIVFSPGLTGHYVGYAAFTGAASGLLGIGGATVLAPLLLQMGADPRRSAPVTATFVLFTSSATALQYLFAGQVDDPSVPVLGVMAFLGSLTGLVFVRWRRHGGQASARIVQALALLMTLSALLAGWVVMQELMLGAQKGFGGLQRNVCVEDEPIVLTHP